MNGGRMFLNNIKAVIFDLGGTLINYEGVPLYWGDYYKDAFQYVKEKLELKLSDNHINKSIEIIKKYNPRLYPREIEYDYKYIFSHVTQGWDIKESDIKNIVNCFFSYFRRNVIVYQDTFELLKWLKEHNYKIGVLTDVPTGMSDNLVQEDISSFNNMIDYCISSVKCGYRKPNKSGLDMLAKAFDISNSNMIFIGDEEKDIKTAKNANCISIFINRKGESKSYGQDYEIKTLTEVKDLLVNCL